MPNIYVVRNKLYVLRSIDTFKLRFMNVVLLFPSKILQEKLTIFG